MTRTEEIRMHRPHLSTRPATRRRRSWRPNLERVEGRQLLSIGYSTALTPPEGLVPYPLASGGTGWLMMPGATGVLANPQPSSDGGIPIAQPTPFDHGVIMGRRPVASPFDGSPSQQSPGPAGYTPIQIQTAYGLSTGSGFNNGISFAGIKGDGSGQTIGIFEDGYNPAFVPTSGYGT